MTQISAWTWVLGSLLASSLWACGSEPAPVSDARVSPTIDSSPPGDAASRARCASTSTAVDHMEWCFPLWSEIESSFSPTSSQGFELPEFVFVNGLALGAQGGIEALSASGGADYGLSTTPCSGEEGLAIELVLDAAVLAAAGVLPDAGPPPDAAPPESSAVPFEIGDDAGDFAMRLSVAGGAWRFETDTGGLASRFDTSASVGAGPQYLAVYLRSQSSEALFVHDDGATETTISLGEGQVYPPSQWRSFTRFIVGRAGKESPDGWLGWSSQIFYLNIACMPLPSAADALARSPF